MANGNVLGGLAQGFEAFTTNRSLADIQERDIERQRLAQSRQLQQQAATGGVGSESFTQLAGIDPDSAANLKNLLRTDNQGLDAAFQDAAVFRSQLQADPTGQRGVQFLQRRVQLGESQGRDMFLTKGLLETAIRSPEEALQEVDSFLDIPNQLRATSAPKTQFGSQQTFKDEQGNLFFATQKRNPTTGAVETAFSPVSGDQQLQPQGQLSLVSGLGQTALEKQAAKSAEERKKEEGKVKTAKQIERDKRLGGFISTGVGAADSAGNIRRAIFLLDSVKTGGFDNVKLRVKQFFGVEGADEGELSNNLGKAVLSQLRATFGAAFTQEEGKSLQRIEAGFGKNTETNKRLLKRAFDTAKKAAQRGIRAANKLGSDFEAEEIQIALERALNEDFNLPAPSPTGNQNQATEKPQGTLNIGRFQVEVQP